MACSSWMAVLGLKIELDIGSSPEIVNVQYKCLMLAGLALGAAVQVAAPGGAHAGDDGPDSLAAEPHTRGGLRPKRHPHLAWRLQVRSQGIISPSSYLSHGRLRARWWLS